MKSIAILLVFTLYLNNHAFGQKKSMMLEGTAKIGENLAMKVAEVSIEEWMSFIIANHYDSTLFPTITLLSEPAQLLFSDLKKGKDFEYLKISKKVHRDVGEFATIEQTSAFTDLCKEDSITFSIIATPITGITYAQATRYCTWMESLVTKHRQQLDITISLPTISIYHAIIPNRDSLNTKGCALYNFIHCSCISQTEKDYNQSLGKYLMRVDAYFPTSAGVYNLQGNAAEMTTIEGKAMGGSYKHFAKDSYADKVIHYTGAEEWLGFRYIVIYN